jgi:hypothetical protein
MVAITDASGLLLEETRYMPFACPRSEVVKELSKMINNDQ